MRFAVPIPVRPLSALLLLAGSSLLAGCDRKQDEPPATSRPAIEPTPTTEPSAPLPPVRDQRLRAVRSFAYQLQGLDGGDLDLAPLVASDFDLFIIDYSRDGGEDGAFGRREIAELKAGGRLVLAYLSIGEAESYRYYWDRRWAPDGRLGEAAPPWLGPTNSAWEGNYKVRYWDEDWQRLIERYLDRIIDAGFDGVYLDIIDAYEFFALGGELPEREDAASLMALFVERIAEYARERRPDFLVVPQNGPAILDALDREQRERYLEAIDGIGAEDSFYFGPLDEDNPLDVQAATLTQLRRFRRAGLLVLAVDYLTDEAKAADFCRRARAEGFVPLPAVRALDRLPPRRCS